MIYTNPLIRPAETPNLPFERTVQNNLSYTPSQMASLTSQGKTSSLAALESSAYFTGEHGQIPFEYVRGVDVNDAFELAIHSRDVVQQFKKSNHHFKSNQSVDPSIGHQVD